MAHRPLHLLAARTRSDSHPAPLGLTLAGTYDDKPEAIADGTAIAVVPAGDQRFTLRPDLVTVPLDEVEPCQVVIATRAAVVTHRPARA